MVLVTPCRGFRIGSKRNKFEKRNKSMNLYIIYISKEVCMYLCMCVAIIHPNSKDPYWPYLWISAD